MISSLCNASRSAGMHFIHRGNYNYNNSIKFVSYGLSQTRTPSQRRPYNLTIWFHSTRIVGFEPTHDITAASWFSRPFPSATWVYSQII